ncbi:MAG: exodeoxyribonuclease III [Gammaproteobacteria bacterium]
MKISTWNVNSINVRLPNVLKYLTDYQPDVLCLQELKCNDDKYPLDSIQNAGYHSIQACQKTYNGVSIISKLKLTDIEINPVHIISDEMRSIAATFQGIRIINFYVVNGQAIESDKYIYKLEWLKKAKTYLKNQLSLYKDLVLVGDFNIVPSELDAHNFSSKDILCSDKERKSLKDILKLGLNDSFRTNNNETPYTWWDYRAGAFHRDIGYRIDLILTTNNLFNGIKSYEVHRDTRHKSWCSEQPKTSDHVPVMITL